jgi:aldose 1-epimerase
LCGSNTDKVLEFTPGLVPNGGMRDVTGTPMDFRKPKALGQDIKADEDLFKAGNGYDNHFVLTMKKPTALALNARVMDPKSGRVMEVWSDEPGEWYSGKIEYKFSVDKAAPKTVVKK